MGLFLGTWRAQLVKPGSLGTLQFRSQGLALRHPTLADILSDSHPERLELPEIRKDEAKAINQARSTGSNVI